VEGDNHVRAVSVSGSANEGWDVGSEGQSETVYSEIFVNTRRINLGDRSRDLNCPILCPSKQKTAPEN
jgi:hypothetical protein